MFRPPSQPVQIAYHAPDPAATLAAARSTGAALALEARTTTGAEFAMLDLRGTLGHMIEVYAGGGGIAKFYRHVKRAADGWDGGDPLRRLRP